MGNQYDLAALALAPAAAELPVQLNEVNGALVLVGPTGIFDLPQFRIYEHQAARSKEWVHPHVVYTHIPVEVSGGGAEERTFQVPPPLDHAGKKFRPARVEGRIKPNREAQLGWRGG